MLNDENKTPEGPFTPAYVKHDDAPQPPQPPNKMPDSHYPNDPEGGFKPSSSDEKELNTARTLTSVAIVAGPVSLLLGGWLLSAAGLVCGFIAFRKLKAIIDGGSRSKDLAARIKKSTTFGLVICAITFVANLAYAIYMVPIIMEMLESGEYQNLLAGSGSAAPETSSAWG